MFRLLVWSPNVADLRYKLWDTQFPAVIKADGFSEKAIINIRCSAPGRTLIWGRGWGKGNEEREARSQEGLAAMAGAPTLAGSLSLLTEEWGPESSGSSPRAARPQAVRARLEWATLLVSTPTCGSQRMMLSLSPRHWQERAGRCPHDYCEKPRALRAKRVDISIDPAC